MSEGFIGYMDNVYGQVALFYRDHEDSSYIIEQDIVERYLRTMAWQGHSDDELKAVWQVLSVVLAYIDAMAIGSCASLTVHDYQEAVWKYSDKKSTASLTIEKRIQNFFAVMQAFCSYLAQQTGESYAEVLAQARDSFYSQGKFVLPKRQKYDEFYTILEHLDEIDADTAEKLNQLLENLLNRIGDYFRRPSFSADLSRAIALYTGPFASPDDEDKEEFWFSFWDYFFFDYHLFEDDLTPLRYFYERERENLQPSELYILRDLLKAKFTVFSIASVQEDFVICTDLFTGEQMELPCPDYGFADFKKTILFGHLHLHGVMMLNYITAVPASARLRKRIKEEILRQYDSYKTYQEPQASLAEFFTRHAAAVRHTINILSAFAQLKVVPIKKVSGRVRQEKQSDLVSPIEESLRSTAARTGYSWYSIQLAVCLYDDFSALGSLRQSKRNYSVIIAAVLLIMVSINSLDYVNLSDVLQDLAVKEKSVLRMVERIEKDLHCVPLDPRYLTEEGFVQALYIV